MTGILITGGSGFFGQAFVRHLLTDTKRNIKRIVVLSRDEFKQSEMERCLFGTPNFHLLRFYLGDVRDLNRLEMAMGDITHVVHAAALKRIEKCEHDPIEAVQTNIIGTANVIQAALRVKSVFNVVGLSTDKACNPVNLYGTTKLAMERLLIAANNLAAGKVRFSAVRYGNIWGSRGSVVHIWRKMLADRADGDVFLPVTDPQATRFFMRIEDAVKLVDEQLFDLDPLTLRIPKVLPAYRLGDLAEAMHTHFEITNLGKHEKLHEELYPGQNSFDAPRMSIDDLRKELERL